MGDTEYVYSDQRGNVYTLRVNPHTGEANFDYDPMTPERSGTGHYSGGTPCQHVLPKSLVEEFVQKFNKLKATHGDRPPTLTLCLEAQFRWKDLATGQVLADFSLGDGLTEWDKFLETLKAHH